MDLMERLIFERKILAFAKRARMLSGGLRRATHFGCRIQR